VRVRDSWEAVRETSTGSRIKLEAPVLYEAASSVFCVLYVLHCPVLLYCVCMRGRDADGTISNAHNPLEDVTVILQPRHHVLLYNHVTRTALHHPDYLVGSSGLPNML
jgi:hypothetical protein